MKKFLFLALILTIVFPASAQAKSKEIRGWRDLPIPTIISTEAPHNGLATVRFSLPDYAGRKVSVWALVRYRSSSGYKGVKVDKQKATMVLDKIGQGAIQLKGLKDRKTYNVVVSVTQLEPHVVGSQLSKMKKLRTIR